MGLHLFSFCRAGDRKALPVIFTEENKTCFTWGKAGRLSSFTKNCYQRVNPYQKSLVLTIACDYVGKNFKWDTGEGEILPRKQKARSGWQLYHFGDTAQTGPSRKVSQWRHQNRSSQRNIEARHTIGKVSIFLPLSPMGNWEEAACLRPHIELMAEVRFKKGGPDF